MRAKSYSRILGFGLAGIVLLLILTPGAAPAAAIEWKMQTVYGANDNTSVCATPAIVKGINDRLKDKLHMTLYMPGQIVPEEEMFDALKRGVYDAAYMAPTWYQSFIPDGIVGFALPMGWQGYDMDMEFFYKFGFLKYMREMHAEQDVYFVCPSSFGDITVMGNFPFRKLEDIKGKKIWSIGTVAAFMKNLGAVPVTFPPAEIYMGLKLGTVDGCVTGISDLEAMNLREVVKYVNLPPIMSSANASFMVSLKTWKNLPPDVQKAFENSIVELLPEIYKCFDDLSVKGIEGGKKAGIQVITMEPSEVQRLRPAALKVWDEIAKRSPRAPKTVQMLKDFLASKGIKLE